MGNGLNDGMVWNWKLKGLSVAWPAAWVGACCLGRSCPFQFQRPRRPSRLPVFSLGEVRDCLPACSSPSGAGKGVSWRLVSQPHAAWVGSPVAARGWLEGLAFTRPSSPWLLFLDRGGECH